MHKFSDNKTQEPKIKRVYRLCCNKTDKPLSEVTCYTWDEHVQGLKVLGLDYQELCEIEERGEARWTVEYLGEENGI